MTQQRRLSPVHCVHSGTQRTRGNISNFKGWIPDQNRLGNDNNSSLSLPLSACSACSVRDTLPLNCHPENDSIKGSSLSIFKIWIPDQNRFENDRNSRSLRPFFVFFVSSRLRVSQIKACDPRMKLSKGPVFNGLNFLS